MLKPLAPAIFGLALVAPAIAQAPQAWFVNRDLGRAVTIGSNCQLIEGGRRVYDAPCRLEQRGTHQEVVLTLDGGRAERRWRLVWRSEHVIDLYDGDRLIDRFVRIN